MIVMIRLELALSQIISCLESKLSPSSDNSVAAFESFVNSLKMKRSSEAALKT